MVLYLKDYARGDVIRFEHSNSKTIFEIDTLDTKNK